MATGLNCPYCGKEIGTVENTVEHIRNQTSFVVPLTLGTSFWASLVNEIKRVISREKEELKEANKWIDIKCPKCGKTYQYNTESSVTKL